MRESINIESSGEAKEMESIKKFKLYHLSDDLPSLLKTGIDKHKGTWSTNFQPSGFFTTETPEHCIDNKKRGKHLAEGEALLELDVEAESQRIWETNTDELKDKYDKWLDKNKEEVDYTCTKEKWTDYLSGMYDLIFVNYPEDSPGWKREVIILEPNIIKNTDVKDSNLKMEQ